MDIEAIIRSCPALAQALQINPALRSVLDQLVAADLHGVFIKYMTDASPQAFGTLLEETKRLDLKRVCRHRQLLLLRESKTLGLEDVKPVQLITLEAQESRKKADHETGLNSLQNGAWASIAFSGGSGTRFFSSLDQLKQAIEFPNERLEKKRFSHLDPKGTFPISPVGGLCFFEIFLAEALDIGFQTQRLPWMLFLTSENTHKETLKFLTQHDLWGLPPKAWLAFKQAQEPRLDIEGNLIVVDDSGKLSWTGDGHGGVFRALLAPFQNQESLLELLCQQNVSNLVMHNVDNPAAHPLEPSRLGFHLREKALLTLSAIRKTQPEEKVGLLLQLKSSGKVEVVEYNVVDSTIVQARDPATGRLLHESGNSNTSLISTQAVSDDIQPTLYTGKKIDSRIGSVESSSMEMLSQHISRLLDPNRVYAFEIRRPDFFMPTKNVAGDASVESTTKMLSKHFQDLLASAGAEVDPTSICDLHPACGKDGQELARKGIGTNWKLESSSRMYLCARPGESDDAPISAGKLELEPGSSLIIRCARPYGEIQLSKNRELLFDNQRISRISIGRNVVIKKGVRVILDVGPDAHISIPSGRTITEDTVAQTSPGEKQIL